MQDQEATPHEHANGPLSGVRVLEFAHGFGGPFACTLLADFGAEVVKVERPGVGDFMRQVDPSGGAWWKSMGRGKRSIAIDLANTDSGPIVKALIENADVFVESFRPGVLEKLGYGPTQLLEWNPSLIVLRISGYGQTGPLRDRPGFGKAAEAFAGLLHMTGFPDGPPVFVGFPIADMCSGLMGAYGVLLAWIARQRGMVCGQVIDLALYETILRLMDYVVPVASGSSVPLVRTGNHQPMTSAPAGVFRSKDGRWITYSAPTPVVVGRVLTLIKGAEFAANARFKDLDSIRQDIDEVDRLVEQWCAEHTAEEIIRGFSDAEAVAALVMTPAEILADPHVRARGSITGVQGEDALFVSPTPLLSKTPGKIRHAATMRVGDDGEAILRDVLGYDPSMIENAIRSGAVAVPPRPEE